jgi:hypothetical protein
MGVNHPSNFNIKKSKFIESLFNKKLIYIIAWSEIHMWIIIDVFTSYFASSEIVKVKYSKKQTYLNSVVITIAFFLKQHIFFDNTAYDDCNWSSNPVYCGLFIWNVVWNSTMSIHFFWPIEERFKKKPLYTYRVI